MGESNDSINGILLETINKETPINFSLLATPLKDTPSISKASAICKIKNYIDKIHDRAAKIQLKQVILRKVKQQLPNETKKGHLDELLHSLYNQFSSLKSEIGFLREEAKEKNKAIRTLPKRNCCECKSSSPCESPKFDNISERNGERRDTCISTTSHSIPKLARQKSRVKDMKIDSVIQADPDETTHLTNTKVTSSDINEMRHITNKEN